MVGARDPPAALNQPADAEGEEEMEEEVVCGSRRGGTAGLLLSGLKSLGAPASKQTPLCFQEDRPRVDMTVPLAFLVPQVTQREVPTSQSDCQE